MAIEKIEVVGYIYGRMLSHPEYIEDEVDITSDQKLMTVARHERIVAALSQKAEPVRITVALPPRSPSVRV